MSSASEMKVFVVLLCAVAGAAASQAVAWPGAVPLSLYSAQIKTVIPPEISGFAYSTSQYINAVPAQRYQPQFGYQISYPGSHLPSYSPLLASSYYPPSSFLYPSPSPIAPAAPAPIGQISPVQPPIQNQPAEQPAGDDDTAVIDSADISPTQQQQPSGESQSPQPQYPTSSSSFPQSSLDSKNMPEVSQIPQFQQVPSFAQFLPPGTNFPQLPQYPQLPQFPQQQTPQFPHIPQISQVPQFPERPQFPQLPQPSFPSFPQNPQTPSFPQTPQIPSFPQTPQIPSFPQTPSGSSDNSDKGMNDEDTVSVDAA